MKFQLALIALLSSTAAATEISVVSGTAEDLVNNLLSNNPALSLVPGTAVFLGENPDCAGIFSGGQHAVPDTGAYGFINFPDTGVTISTGFPQFLADQSTDRKTGFLADEDAHDGDPDLNAIVDGMTADKCGIEFQFFCAVEPCNVQFQYVWGSEEYTEFVESEFNDAFAWILNGENIAMVPGTDTPVSIDTVNDQVNSNYFINNDVTHYGNNFENVPYPLFEPDGFTFPLAAEGVGNGGDVANPGINTIKLVVADRSDRMFDSWALFKENSFTVTTGGGGGDPHFMRWGSDHRDSFHGECDLVVYHSDDFNQHGLDFHVRTTMYDDLYSFIESAAIRLGQDILEIHNGHVLLNGVKHDDNAMPLEFGEKKYKFALTKVDQRDDGSVVRRAYSLSLDGKTSIAFKFYKDMMTFNVIGHPHFENGTGLLGAYPSGAMLNRAGARMNNFIDFGFEWQVTPEDGFLFAQNRMPQLPYERCRMPSRTAESSRRRLRGNQKLMESAQKACSHIKGSDFALCVDDVVMTGDVELANEW